jgi:hypothetical protein
MWHVVYILVVLAVVIHMAFSDVGLSFENMKGAIFQEDKNMFSSNDLLNMVSCLTTTFYD